MMNKIFRPGVWTAILTLALATPLGTGGWIGEAQAGGPRLSVTVSEPFEFQGRIWPAGPLSVMPTREYNPSSSLDEIWIGTECLGRMFADRRPAADPTERDVVFFERNANQRLVLVGYSLRGAGESYRYRPAPLVVDKDDIHARVASLR